jgi:hypothetical protein
MRIRIHIQAAMECGSSSGSETLDPASIFFKGGVFINIFPKNEDLKLSMLLKIETIDHKFLEN